MNGDDMTRLAALFLALGLASIVLAMRWYAGVLDDPLSTSGLSRAVFVVMLIATAAALGLLAYDVFTAGPGYRMILEIPAIVGFSMGCLLARESVAADDAKRG